MASRYVPPHLRSKQQNSQQQHSSPSPQAKTKERNPSDGYTADEIANQFGCAPDTKVGTLNAAEADESKLAFVLVFKDQHPEWPPRIFCKSNLHLLTASASPTPTGGTLSQTPGAEGRGNVEDQLSSSAPALTPDLPEMRSGPEDEGKNTGEENDTAHDNNYTITNTNINESSSSTPHLPTHLIPLFTQDSLSAFTPLKMEIFFFKGWYHIKSVTYLEPKSPELIKMLDGKFTPAGKKRSPEQWERSLGMRWGVVEFVPDGEGDAKGAGGFGKGDGEGVGKGKEEKGLLGNPMVPLKPMAEKEAKSVREMLEEIRLRDEKKGTVKGAS
ncbi:MAG: hypothetical protein Q9201_007508 [Fulgogasparrea decipioides]